MGNLGTRVQFPPPPYQRDGLNFKFELSRFRCASYAAGKVLEGVVLPSRIDAIQEIYSISGSEGVLAFAAHVENPSQVGFALGKLESAKVINDLLSRLVLSPEAKRHEFAQGFVWAMWHREQWT